MITWPISRARHDRKSLHRSQPWHRDEAAAARSISRWEDDGGRVDHGSERVTRPLSNHGPALPAHARHF